LRGPVHPDPGAAGAPGSGGAPGVPGGIRALPGGAGRGARLSGTLSREPNVAAVDWLVIAAYFALLLGVAWWVARRNTDTAADYFLAGRNLGWFLVGASIFASNIGSEHVVGLAGAGATSGVALAPYERQPWCLLLVGARVVPIYS